MKSTKVALAAIIVAALMVIPIALYATDDKQSEAVPDYAELSGFMTSINWEKLMSLDYTKTSMTNNPAEVPDQAISADTAVNYGEWMFLSKNYKFSNNAVLTIKNGASVTICPTQGFSFSTESGYGTLVLEQGAKIIITTDGNTPTSANTVAEFPVDTKNTTVFQGRYAYDKDVWEFTFSAAKDSTFTDNADAAQRKALITFTEENKFVVKATVNSNESKTDVNVSIKCEKIQLKYEDLQADPAAVVKLNGSLDYNVSVVAPATSTSTQKDLTASIKGNSNVTADLNEVYDASMKTNFDINVKVENFADTLDPTKSDDNVKSNLNGSMSVEYSTSKGMDNYKPEGSDVAITLKDASASYKMNFNNQDVSGEVNFRVGNYSVTTFSDTGNEVVSFENINLNGKYGGFFKPENKSPLAVTAPAAAPSPKTIIDEYMNGVADKTSADEIKKYAAEFFLGEFDQYSGLVMTGFQTTSLKAEVNVGKADYGQYLVEGFNASMEINDSVGAKANVSVNRVTINPGVGNPMGMSKINVGSSNITVYTATDVENKAMFTVDFGTSVEMKNYISGSLASSVYMKDFKGKATIAKTNSMDSLTIGEVSTSTYGVSSTVSNITLDVEKNTFTAGEMKIKGNYYGPSMVKSVDGSYKNVTITPIGLSLAPPTAESVSLRIDDIDGDHLDFTRTYDATTNVITNTYSVDGQMYIADIATDDVLNGLMMATITGADDKTTEVNVLKGGVLAPEEVSMEPSPLPGVTITGKNATIGISPTCELETVAPAEFYVSNSSAISPYTNSGAFELNDEIYEFNIKGASLGINMDADGNITYSLLALPGYTLSDDMTYAGMTISDCNDKTAKVTSITKNITCTAIPVKYKLSIDGKEVKNDVEYASTVSGDGLDKDVLFLVDSNGVIVDVVDDGCWSFNYYFTKDVDLKTVKTSKLTTVDATKINQVDAEGASFTVPATGGSSLQFALSSKVRFDLTGLLANDNVDLIAQKTNFEGHDGFIIKAVSNNSLSLESTLYIPVSGSGQKLMHVDEYGRVSERVCETVVIDDQTYLKTTTSDYSIFYTENDDSPVINNGGNGGISPVLIIVGAVIAVAVIGVAVYFIRKN